MRKAVGLAVALLSGFGVAPAAMAQCSVSGWCFVWKTEEGEALYMKRVSRDGQIATVNGRYISDEFPDSWHDSQLNKLKDLRIYDCITGRWRFEDEQKWRNIFPGTNGELAFNFACR